MSLRFKKSLDKNHKDIVDSLKKCGVDVLEVLQPVDIVTYYADATVWIDIKREKNAHVERSQIKFFSTWKGLCGIAQTFEEALKMAKSPVTSERILTGKQKDKLARFLLTWHEKQLHLPTFYEVIK